MARESEMTPPSLGLDDAYSLETPEDNLRLYKDWADTYESEFMADHGYVYHLRVADRFGELAERGDSPVLDVGCGTGVVGESLARIGGWAIDGLDISPEMLVKAELKRNQAGEPVYGSLIEADLTTTLEIPTDTYGSVVSAGTFTIGHVGPSAIVELVRIVRRGGLLVLGINSRFYANEGFESQVRTIVADGSVTQLETVVLPMYDTPGGKYSDDTSHIIGLRVI